MRRRSGAVGVSVKLASILSSPPRIVTSRRDTEESKGGTTGKRTPRAFDSAPDPRSCRGIGDLTVGQGEARGSQGRDENCKDGSKLSVPPPKIHDLSSQLVRRRTENVQRDDVVVRNAEPAPSSRPRDTLFYRQLDVAGLVDEFLEPVVVDSLESCRCWHPAIITAGLAS